MVCLPGHHALTLQCFLGRQGKPKERILFNGVDDALAILYWADEQELIDHKARKAIGIPQGARSLVLRNVREIRRGTDLDPTRTGYCGTANLRKYCEPIDYAYCISLVFVDRFATLLFSLLTLVL